jgi:hypothetical protein
MTRFGRGRTAIVAALTALSLLAVTPVAMAQSRPVTVVGWHKCGTFRGTMSWNGWHTWWTGPWYFPYAHFHLQKAGIHLNGRLYSTCRGDSTVYLSYFDGLDRNYASGSVAGRAGSTKVTAGHLAIETPQGIAVAVCTSSIKPRGWYCRTDYF